MTQDTATQEAVQQQVGKLLGQVAGFVGVRTVEMGLRHGLLKELAAHPDGLTPDALAERTDVDAFYAGVWCRTAYAAEVLELSGEEQYRLAPHLDQLLLNEDFPGYVGGLFRILATPEMSQWFSERLPSGERTWWDQVSPDFIQGVAGTSRPFYTRLLAAGIDRVPGLGDRLSEGAHVLELASGAGSGLVRLARAYPQSTFVGLDGDAYSLELATGHAQEAGVGERVNTLLSTLEDLEHAEQYDVVLINVSMHECRDIERVTANVHRALKPGGQFVISDFPFPESHAEMRTVPARVLSGIQYFEALIDDQLLPTQAYVDLLNNHDFNNVAAFDLAPVHCVVHGQK